MTSADAQSGRIVSFYSFKGGVGRTMALANVAFLAANNGLNVLVMDWDLEAPGLYHYFRGLIEPDEMAALRDAPGVLDLAWRWRTSIERATGAEDVVRHFEIFNSGEPFQSLVRSIIPPSDFEETGRLDIIQAGGREVATPDIVEYERALAAFSWNDFLDKYAGGGMIGALRKWAASQYDLVLVDSRTGLADVAGICTMQLPDAVVLAFALNRQNIEGVARVASAIRLNRGKDVRIWAVPMRVSREGTDEEADATARALRELTRPGRLERSTTEKDLKGLLIMAEPNVPFMESLSVFNETNSALDPLTANMARLASEITGKTIAIPEISQHERDIVNNRLAPTLSTDAYLRQLLTSEPNRAARALHGYVESAISTLAEGDEVPEEYVTALAETSFALQQRGDGDVAYNTANRVALLVKRLAERDPPRWRTLLVQALESRLDSEASFLEPEDEVGALDEIDDLLAAEDQAIGTLERRALNRMRASRLFEAVNDRVQQLAAADEALAHINAAQLLDSGAVGSLRIILFEAILQKASAHEALDQWEEAYEDLYNILKLLPGIDSDENQGEVARIGFDANYRLMRLLRSRDSAFQNVINHAVAAVEYAQPATPLFLSRIAEIAEVVTSPSQAASGPAALLLRKVLSAYTSSPGVVQFFGRALAAANRVILALARLLQTAKSEMNSQELEKITRTAIDLIKNIVVASEDRLIISLRRGLIQHSRMQIDNVPVLISSVESFIDAAKSTESSLEIRNALIDLNNRTGQLVERVQLDRATVLRRRKPPEDQ